MTIMAKKNEIQTVEPKNWALMKKDGVERIRNMVEIMREDPDAYTVDSSILNVIKTPGGESKNFELPDGSATSELDVIILFTNARRAMYAQSYEESGGNAFPICTGSIVQLADVGKGEPSTAWRGFGAGRNETNPDGNCDSCAFSRFKNAKIDPDASDEEKKKAAEESKPDCGQQLQIYMLTADSKLPVICQAPVTAIKHARKFFSQNVMDQGLKYSQYITRIGLDIVPNASGLKHALFTFEFIRALTPDECGLVDVLAAEFKPLFKNTIIVGGKPVDVKD